MQVIEASLVSSNEARRQAVIELFALYPGFETQSDKRIATDCLCTDLRSKTIKEIDSNPEWKARMKEDMKFVKAMKKEYAKEKFSLFHPITDEIARIRAIKRCCLCGVPVTMALTETIKGQEMHIHCIDRYNKDIDWKHGVWFWTFVRRGGTYNQRKQELETLLT